MQSITILHVEDNDLVRNVVKDTLELEGWRVVTCANGIAALKKLESSEHYDLLLFDYDLPGVSGFELACHARALAHRRHTPIIMLSAGHHREEARRAGVDVFLGKPEDIRSLTETVERLLVNVNVSPTD